MSDASTAEGKTAVTAHLARLALCAGARNFGAAITGAGLGELAGVDVVEASVGVREEGELARLRFVVVDVNGTRAEAGLVFSFDETHCEKTIRRSTEESSWSRCLREGVRLPG